MVIVVVGVQHHRQRDLAHIIFADRGAPLLFGLDQGGQQQRAQEHHNRDDHQQFEQVKAGS
jgi:hypothetical protein